MVPPKNFSRPSSVPLPERGNSIVSMRKPSVTPLGKMIYTSNSAERLPISVLSPSRMVRQHNTATVRPNNMSTARAISMPHLQTGIKTYQPKRDGQSPTPWIKKDGVKRMPEPLDRNKVSLALEKWRMMKSYHLPKENQEKVRPLRSLTLRNSSSYPSLPNDQVSSSDGKKLVLISLKVFDIKFCLVKLVNM